ncbi:hypothetical protein HMPREF0083_01144 [Aneurinibacillus aneurinilyticus ATCC 12856]|uniref:Uncharacterized protein n=1 Tax=Aneurinibacillus aneurinilyticus ATCC 12856 TaxID=649747 RepID=U1YIX4_ANEAE|nr:hypothetical protein HMPREF0083_01144 [Aneurinibacillus aneurinilyticus ATCC 12856]
MGRRRFGKKKRGDAPCAPAEERPACLFPIALAHSPSFFPASHHKFIKSDVYNHAC